MKSPKFEVPIIKSKLDTDWYKLTMGQFVFFNHPDWYVKYQFKNRSDIKFDNDLVEELKKQIDMMSGLTLTQGEQWWLERQPGMKRTYVEWFATHKFNPMEVNVYLDYTTNDLCITISEYWYKAIYWEVPLMAIISELFFRRQLKVKEKPETWRNLNKKITLLKKDQAQISDFGTRRRFSYSVQERVVETLANHDDIFIGTCNPYLAKGFGIKPIGTYGHEGPMAYQVYDGPNHRDSDTHWASAFNRFYDQELKNKTILTDTLTSQNFYRYWWPREDDTIRQDSGDPYQFTENLFKYHKMWGMDTSGATIIYSDGLDVPKYLALHKKYKNKFLKVLGGIGTNLTNDCGYKPLNMVIKLTDVYLPQSGGNKHIAVVKISDNPEKASGNQTTVDLITKELAITNNQK